MNLVQSNEAEAHDEGVQLNKTRTLTLLIISLLIVLTVCNVKDYTASDTSIPIYPNYN